VAELEHLAGSRLPAAVREWFVGGGDERLVSMTDNVITKAVDLAGSDVGRFLGSGYLLLETDSQHCCRWVTPLHAVDDDPPVYLVDPEDYACDSRTRFADRFSSYTLTCAWDALLWHDDGIRTDFDYPLSSTVLDQLKARLSELPSTHGWAGNQGCDTVYRFEGHDEPVRVGVAVRDTVVLWSVISAPSPGTAESIARMVGALS
jgi:hypothetical protein